MTASASAPAESASALSDLWFIREGDQEHEISTVSCEGRHCQLIDLPFSLYSGYCKSVYNLNDSVEIGDEVRKYWKVTEPGKITSGSRDQFVCQSDGTWFLSTASSGGTGGCDNCETEWTDRWYVNQVLVQENSCTTSCETTSAPHYEYLGLTGLGGITPEGSSYTRCVYEEGVLTSATIAGCSTEFVNSWTNYGSDSSCPETVEDLNSLAAADGEITPCSTDSCVFWKSSWGHISLTKEIP